MQLDNVKLEDVRKFLYSMTADEFKFYDMDIEREIRTALYITGVRFNGELIGVAGIATAYKVMPHTFYMVRKDAQGKRVGTQLQKKLFDYLMQHKTPLILQTAHKGNIAANKLHSQSGAVVVWEDDENCHRVKTITTTGKVIAIFIPVAFWLFHSPVGRLVSRLKRIPSLGM